MTDTFIKDPNAVLDYTWDWSEWLTGAETISSATVTAPTGLTLDSQSNTTTTVTAWLSGGTAISEYAVSCRIVTSDGRTDDRTITIVCKER